MAAENNSAQTTGTDNGQNVTKQIDKLGISVSSLSANQISQAELKIKAGLMVQNVTSDAQFAGIASGDVIIGVANTPVTTVSELEKLLTNYKPGQAVALKLLRSTGSSWVTIFIPLIIAK